MVTLHIENTVRDFGAWKANFDQFEEFRTAHRMRSYRLSRYADDPATVVVDMDFDSVTDANSFRHKLTEVVASTPAQSLLVKTTGPRLLEAIEDRTL